MFKKLFDENGNLKPTPPPEPVPELIIAVTGHRPDKLPDRASGYRWDNPVRVWCREQIRATTQRLLDDPKRRHPLDTGRSLHIRSLLRGAQWRTAMPTSGPLMVTGMALGIDQDATGVWVRMGLPVLAVVPFVGQELRWPAESQRLYQHILQNHVAGVLYLAPAAPAGHDAAVKLLLGRNERMCELGDELIAVHDGSAGGTAACVKSWRFINRLSSAPHHIDPRECPAHPFQVARRQS
jgi:hypothetical protein